MYRWAKIFQLSKAIGKINFSFLNFRYKLKERPDAYVIVLSCFVLSIIGVFYYYYFQMLGQLYDGLSELGLGALFCRLALFAVAMILSIASAFLLINVFCFSKDIEHLLLFPVRPCDIFTGKYLAVILLCYGIEILLLLPVCIIQTQYMGNVSVIITYISAAAILPSYCCVSFGGSCDNMPEICHASETHEDTAGGCRNHSVFCGRHDWRSIIKWTNRRRTRLIELG